MSDQLKFCVNCVHFYESDVSSRRTCIRTFPDQPPDLVTGNPEYTAMDPYSSRQSEAFCGKEARFYVEKPKATPKAVPLLTQLLTALRRFL